MQIANKFMMVAINVGDMAKSKAFYAEKLGFDISTEYRQDDNNWWVSLTLPDGGATITLSRASSSPESVKEGTLTFYIETSDVKAAHTALRDKGVVVDDVQDDLFGPGSGVQWCAAKDPDGNTVMLAQKHDSRAPF